jgi:hypothetical protein
MAAMRVPARIAPCNCSGARRKQRTGSAANPAIEQKTSNHGYT